MNPATISNNKRFGTQKAMISEENACTDRSIRVQIHSYRTINMKAILFFPEKKRSHTTGRECKVSMYENSNLSLSAMIGERL